MMKIRKRKLSSLFGIVRIVVPIVIIVTFLLLGKIIIGLSAALFISLVFLLAYGPVNKITLHETSITEKTTFGSKTLQWKEIRQVGLVFRAYKKRFLIKESFAPRDANHTEIYILNYRTFDAPNLIDGGKRITFDYNHEMWQFLKNNPQLHDALKQGELAASKNKISLF